MCKSGQTCLFFSPLDPPIDLERRELPREAGQTFNDDLDTAYWAETKRKELVRQAGIQLLSRMCGAAGDNTRVADQLVWMRQLLKGKGWEKGYVDRSQTSQGLGSKEKKKKTGGEGEKEKGRYRSAEKERGGRAHSSDGEMIKGCQLSLSATTGLSDCSFGW